MTENRCDCEHAECHPNGNCETTDDLAMVETYGIKQRLCAACRRPDPRGVYTAYRVHCPDHGAVNLTEREYLNQLSRANARWACPICGEMPARWDDDHYERVINCEVNWCDGCFEPVEECSC